MKSEPICEAMLRATLRIATAFASGNRSDHSESDQ